MGVGDSELFDRAFDAAEAKVADAQEAQPTQETIEVPEGAQSEPSPTVEQTAEVQAQEKAQANRDKSGKFLKGKSPAAQAKQSKQVSQADNDTGGVDVQEVGDATSQGEGVNLPGFWKPEEKAAIAKAPREVQELIARREAQRLEYDRRIAREVEPAKAYINKARELWEPHRAKFQTHGIKDDLDAMGRLLAWNEIFESDPKLAISDLMRKNGLSGHDFIDDGSGNDYDPNYGHDPRLDEAHRAAEEAREIAKNLQLQLQEQQTAQGRAFVEQFKQGKDSAGQPRAKFFDAYKPQIVQAYQEIQRISPELSEAEVLNHAYEFTMQQIREMHGIKSGVSKPSPEFVKKAQAAAKSVSGAPSSSEVQARSKLKGKNFNEKFDSAFNNVAERLGL